jgi:uncharacterized membrane protein
MLHDVSELMAITLLRSIPLIGPALVLDRKTLARLSFLFESDDNIHRDINKVVQNMAEAEEIMIRLKSHIEQRKNDLQQTLDEYQRFKGLAEVEKEKAQALLKEFRKEGNKGIVWGLAINLIMVILGVILAHFLRIWIPTFNF